VPQHQLLHQHWRQRAPQHHQQQQGRRRRAVPPALLLLRDLVVALP
jgi:hypothetical protein